MDGALALGLSSRENKFEDIETQKNNSWIVKVEYSKLSDKLEDYLYDNKLDLKNKNL